MTDGDPYGYEINENGYYNDYKELFDALSDGAYLLLEALKEYDITISENWDDMTVAMLGETHTVLGYDTNEMDYFHMVNPYCEDLAVQEAEQRLMRITKRELIHLFRTVMVSLVLFFDLKSAHDCLTSIGEELDRRRTEDSGMVPFQTENL